MGNKVVKAQRTEMRHLGTDRVHANETEYEAFTGYPHSVLSYGKDGPDENIETHPFAKPIDLLEFLIRSYSEPGELVLDNTMGSGSTCIAAMNTGRRSIGIEMDPDWFAVAQARISKHASAKSNIATASHVVSSSPEEKLAEHADKEGARSNPNLAPACNRQIAVTASTPSIVSPAIQLGKASLYTGDCLEVMRSMKSESVDLIFTSPPYNLGVPVGGRKTSGRKLGHRKVYRGYASHNDNMPHKNYVSWMRSVLEECWRLLRPDGAIFFNHKPRIDKLNLVTPAELNPNLPLRQIVIWNRKGGTNFNGRFFTPSHEWIMIFAKPGFKLKRKLGALGPDVWTIPPARNNDHPAPFPVELPLRAIQSCNAKVILDPFSGSGTTGVAAVRSGREYIGIELSAEYNAQAETRIAEEIEAISRSARWAA